MTLRALQQHIRNKDHRPGHELEYLQKLVEEVGELARAMRQPRRYAQTGQLRGSIDEELYDVLYYVAALANLHEVELEEAMRLKEPVNAARWPRRAE